MASCIQESLELMIESKMRQSLIVKRVIRQLAKTLVTCQRERRALKYSITQDSSSALSVFLILCFIIITICNSYIQV